MRLLDGLFLLAVLLLVATSLLLGRYPLVGGAFAVPGWWSLLFAALSASGFTVCVLGRLAIEFHCGLCVNRCGVRRVVYERASRPNAFWWAMMIEGLVLLCGIGAAYWGWQAVLG